MPNREVKLKMSDVLAANQGLAQIGQSGVKFETAFLIAKCRRACNEEAKEYEEQRKALIEKYGAKNAKGEFAINVDASTDGYDADKLEGFKADLSELLTSEIQMTVPALKVSSLTNRKGDKPDIQSEALFSCASFFVDFDDDVEADEKVCAEKAAPAPAAVEG